MATKIVKAKKGATLEKAIASYVDADKTQGNGTIEVWRGFIEAKIAGDFTYDEVPAIMARMNARIAKQREANGDPRPLAMITDPRISEFKSILKLSEYACWPTVLGYFKDAGDVSKETLNTVAKFVRKQVKGDAMKSPSMAPSKDAIMADVVERRYQKRGFEGYAGVDKDPDAIPNVTNGATSLASVIRTLRGIAVWFGDDEGKRVGDDKTARTIAPLIKSLQQMEKSANALIKARDKAKDAAKAAADKAKAKSKADAAALRKATIAAAVKAKANGATKH